MRRAYQKHPAKGANLQNYPTYDEGTIVGMLTSRRRMPKMMRMTRKITMMILMKM